MNAKSPPAALCLIDGPNIDAVLGLCVLQRQPRPEERPRWDRVHGAVTNWYGVDRPVFVLNGNRFDSSGIFAFRRTLRSLGYRVECPRSAQGDPVDDLILDRLDAALAEDVVPDVVLLAHDHGYAPLLKQLMEKGAAVAIVGFPEELSPALLALRDDGAVICDLEHDLHAFDVSLNRPVGPGSRAA